MTSTLTKTALAFVALGLAPIAPLLSGDEAYAHSGVSFQGTVSIATPIAVIGFSYGDPYRLGHVHRGVEYCSHGPLYYYPSYRVYGHFNTHYQYRRYARPVYGHQHSLHHDRGYDYGRHNRHARAHSPRARHDSRAVRMGHRESRHEKRYVKSHRTKDRFQGRHREGRSSRNRGSRIRGH